MQKLIVILTITVLLASSAFASDWVVVASDSNGTVWRTAQEAISFNMEKSTASSWFRVSDPTKLLNFIWHIEFDCINNKTKTTDYSETYGKNSENSFTKPLVVSSIPKIGTSYYNIHKTMCQILEERKVQNKP